MRPRYRVDARGHLLDLGQSTKIMGIVNITPDSFSQDGCWGNGKNSSKRTIKCAERLIAEGADIIDIGGESSRPGATPISAQEEIDRIIPTIRYLAKHAKIPISVDTYKPLVAQCALGAGASIINNIQGTQLQKNLLKIIKNYDAAVILMHMHGLPKTMQKNIRYKNLVPEIIHSLQNSIEKCFESGIKSDKIIIDPGIGFGKTVIHNLEIINRLSDFHKLNHPILIGTSRKSFIGKILNKDVNDRLLGTAATVGASILKGAHLIRVHDVAAMKQITKMTDAILNWDNGIK